MSSTTPISLDKVELSPRNFEPAELARVAAARPFWLRWLLDLSDFDKFAGSSGCKKCGTHRKVLFLRRKKLLWCPSCEGAKLAALLADFERLVEEKRRAGGGRAVAAAAAETTAALDLSPARRRGRPWGL